MVTLDTLENWLTDSNESEHLDFKEAKQQYDFTKLLRYCVAFANEFGGHLVLGVSDELPRRVVGTQAFLNIGDIKSQILNKLHFRVEVYELSHPDGRVLVFEIPPRSIAQPQHLDGVYLMRSGEELVPMTPDQLRRIILEEKSNWFVQLAKSSISADEVISLLDTQSYFELLKLPYPTNRDGVLERLTKDGLITVKNNSWAITNLAAILLAKRLDAFSPALARKAPRVVIYKGVDKLSTQHDKSSTKGYAADFDGLLEFVHSAAPQNCFIEQVVREEVKMFPRQALRELIANALVHQDFLVTGSSVMIEMFSDRVEISNPGIPPISIDRFIDEYRSRNELLADFMRRLGFCEEKGSGIDKVVKLAEIFQLPAPDFRVGECRTTAVLFAYQEFADMSKSDRIRACYQHGCLLYVSNQRMSNQTLRDRFKLPESAAATVSLVISAAKDAGLIKPDDAETSSTRYIRYLPFWA
ncbi:MAG TPA: ATP-binding protein [Gammaproteobacteria bacterium]|jgi:ATP-dependent DNA helicase RecG|nr:ATP-binding protein [Gammaproteobacteria bacterium]